MKTTLLLLVLLLLACQKPARKVPLPTVDAGVQTSLLDSAARPSVELSAKHEQHGGLDWYVDSAEAALQAAEQTGRFVLVDLWAPWCHTCLSMRSYVLTATHLADVRERLVFLALDTERPENAPWLKRWAVSSWPTLYLVDSAGDVQGRWVGAASPAQLSRFVRESLRVSDATLEGAVAQHDPLRPLIVGDRESAEGKWLEASLHYREALQLAATDWPRRPETWVALAGALRKLGDTEACVQLGLEVLGEHGAALGDSASATDFSYLTLDCANGLPAADARRKTLARAVVKQLGSLCERGASALTPDDRGDACGLLMEQQRALGQRAGERRAAEQRLRVLEAAARDVPDEIAQTYDWARSETLLALARGAEALRLLEARERALPDDYNPPYYLARVDKALARWPEGLAAIDRAYKLAYGPRRVGMLALKGDLLLAAGRRSEARRTLEEQLAAYRALPEAQQNRERERSIAQRLRELAP